MPKITKILLPTDFSSCSEAALEHATELARTFGAPLDLLHVWEAPAFLPPETIIGPVDTGQSLASLARKQAFEDLDHFADAAKARGFEIAKREIAFGPPARTIIEHAEKNGHDLIVMGTHGRSGFAHLLLGSVAERVVRYAKCPVLTVREKAAAE
jgi:nucleotide-binding universal stress UspA family protein